MKKAAHEAEERHECFLAENRIHVQQLAAELDSVLSKLPATFKQIDELKTRVDEMYEDKKMTISGQDERAASEHHQIELLNSLQTRNAQLSERLAQKNEEILALREDLLSRETEITELQKKIVEMSQKEEELLHREEELTIRLRKLQKSRADEEVNQQNVEEVKRLRELLSQQSDELSVAMTVIETKVG